MDALREFLVELTGICAASALAELLAGGKDEGFGVQAACRVAALLCLMRSAERLVG